MAITSLERDMDVAYEEWRHNSCVLTRDPVVVNALLERFERIARDTAGIKEYSLVSQDAARQASLLRDIKAARNRQ